LDTFYNCQYFSSPIGDYDDKIMNSSRVRERDCVHGGYRVALMNQEYAFSATLAVTVAVTAAGAAASLNKVAFRERRICP